MKNSPASRYSVWVLMGGPNDEHNKAWLHLLDLVLFDGAQYFDGNKYGWQAVDNMAMAIARQYGIGIAVNKLNQLDNQQYQLRNNEVKPKSK